MKKQNRLIVTIGDIKLLRKIELIPKPHRGKVVERALAMYMESSEGAGVLGLFNGGSYKTPRPALGKEIVRSKNILKTVLGDY